MIVFKDYINETRSLSIMFSGVEIKGSLVGDSLHCVFELDTFSSTY